MGYSDRAVFIDADSLASQKVFALQNHLASRREAVKVYVKFSPDGKFMMTQSVNVMGKDVLTLWDALTGRPIKEFEAAFPVADFSPDSKWLALNRIWRNVGLLNLETFEIHPASGIDDNFYQHAFSPDSQTYVTGSGYEKVHATLIDVSTGQPTKKIPIFSKWGFDVISVYLKDVDILSFHPSSKFLMGANHNSVRIWNISTGQPVWQTTDDRSPAAFSPDGKLLVTIGKDKKTVLLWGVLSN